jgi:hypothetical protein
LKPGKIKLNENRVPRLGKPELFNRVELRSRCKMKNFSISGIQLFDLDVFPFEKNESFFYRTNLHRKRVHQGSIAIKALTLESFECNFSKF